MVRTFIMVPMDFVRLMVPLGYGIGRTENPTSPMPTTPMVRAECRCFNRTAVG
jgi:hypothetical protein